MRWVETGIAAVLGGVVALGLSLFASDLFTGKPGADGVAGAAGVAGPAGPAGPQGETGVAGADAAAGAPGADGEAGPQGESGPQGAPGPQGAAGAGDLGAGAVVLVRGAGDCPPGWAKGGEVRLLTSPDYTMTADQSPSNPGVFTSQTSGWSDVNFFLCQRGAE